MKKMLSPLPSAVSLRAAHACSLVPFSALCHFSGPVAPRRPRRDTAVAVHMSKAQQHRLHAASSVALVGALVLACVTSAQPVTAADVAAPSVEDKMLSIGVPAPTPRTGGNPDLVLDKYGMPQQKLCPYAYFPCFQDGYFCFRPIYCKGQFSPEGTLNAMVIIGGILAPAYSIWRQKAGLEPDPNTPEGLEYWKGKYQIEEKKESGNDVLKSSFFSRGLAKESAELGADPAQETTDK